TATALRLQPDHARAQLAELAETQFEAWAKQESFTLAKDHVYRYGQLRGSTDQHNGEVLPADYIPTVKPLAAQRIVLAGYRLADVLQQQFAQEGPPTTPAPASPPPPGPTPASPVSGGEVRENRHSHIYHLPGCPGYVSMRPANIVPFATEAEAQQAGYRK